MVIIVQKSTAIAIQNTHTKMYYAIVTMQYFYRKIIAILEVIAIQLVPKIFFFNIKSYISINCQSCYLVIR